MRSLIPSFRLLKSVALLSLLPALPVSVYAEEEVVEFDASFFSSGGEAMDVARFGRKDFVPAGSYDVDVFVNGELKGRSQLEYIEAADNKTELCVTPQLAEVFDLRGEAFGTKQEGKCQSPATYIPEAKIKLDQSVLALKVEIPQALTVVRPRGYISQHLWESGVPAAFVNYNISNYNHKHENHKSDSQYLYLNGGVNAGGWALRHTGSLSRNNGKTDSYQRGVTYLKKGIGSLNSELTLGDFTTEGAISDSVSMRGAMMRTDTRMLPQTQRGYAPRVSGIANTNATVIIRQNGMVIYQTNVPAGPFEINDLYPTGYSGELIAEVHEADGNVQRFAVPYATLVPLMRPEQFNYQLAGGVYRNGNLILSDEQVATGSVQYGLTNNVTLNGGFIAHSKYHSETIGAAVNTKYGAISGDITKSAAKLGDRQKTEHGTSIRAAYNLHISPTRTNITLANYRYFSRGYYSFDETVTVNRMGLEEDGIAKIQEWRAHTLRPKNRYQLTMSQELKDGWGTVYFSGAISNYWNYEGRNVDYQLSYGNNYKELNYNVGVSQYRQADDNQTNRQIFMSLSVPLDFGSSSLTNRRSRFGYSNTSYTTDTKGRRSLRQSLSGSGGEYSQYGYGLSVATSPFYTSTAVNANYRSSIGQFDASYTMDSDDSKQFSFGASGAVVAHPKGVTLSNAVGSTFGVVHAKNGAGARLNNGLGKKLDMFGNAIVESLTPYEYNRIGVDPAELPMNIEFDATEREIVPIANSTMMVDLNAHKNTMVLFNVHYPEREIPMGTEAIDAKGRSVGFVAQGGMLYANRLNDEKGTVNLKWGADEGSACHFDYHVSDLDQESMQNIDVTCLANENKSSQ